MKPAAGKPTAEAAGRTDEPVADTLTKDISGADLPAAGPLATAEPPTDVAGPTSGAIQPAVAAARGPRRRQWWGALGSGWIPGTVLAAAAAGCLLLYGVTGPDLAAFSAYVVLGLALPGMLVTRALRGGARGLGEDLATGLVVGYAIELACYLPARAADRPLLVLVWPAATLVVFAGVPRLHRYWRGGGRAHRPSPGATWGLAAVVALVAAHSVVSFFPRHGLRYPSVTAPHLDIPFQLALVGELRHHMPPVIPYVAGEELQYHWFVHAHMAASSWVTGVEPQVLLLRLSVLPMLVAIVTLTAAAARRVTGKGWPGPVAALLAFFATTTSPYGWTTAPSVDGNVVGAAWMSPTQVFGMALLAGLLVVLVDMFAGGAPHRGWTLAALLVLGLVGAKAVMLPMLTAGLALTVVVVGVVRRRLHRPAAIALVLAALGLAFAQLVLFGGGAQGTVVAPFAVLKRTALADGTDLLGPASTADNWALLWLLAALSLLSVAPGLAGHLGLLRVRRRWPRAVVLTFLGTGVAGVGATLLLGHPGLGQLYFLQAARPPLAIAAACGLALLAAASRPAARWSALGAVAIGAASAVTLRRMTGPDLPHRGRVGTTGALIWELLWPYTALVGVAVLTAAVVAVAARRAPARAATAGLLTAAVLTGMALPGGYNRLAALHTFTQRTGWAEVRPQGAQLPLGALQAARWLRDNSDPDDLVATNVHCRIAVRGCDNRHFWISAYTERRVLIEGWGYTEEAMARSELYVRLPAEVPYWRPSLLVANDAAFNRPTVRSVGRLHTEYGVRWLFVDPQAPVSGNLWRYATLRFAMNKTAVYELPPDVLPPPEPGP